MRSIIEQNKKTVVTVALLLVLFVGGTFAYLSLTLNANQTNVLKASSLELVLDETDAEGILLENAIPVRDSVGLSTDPYTFKLKNTGDINANYTIYLDDEPLGDGETRMLDSFIKYSLVKDTNEPVTALLTTLGTNPRRVLTTGVIPANTTYTYSLRVWINQDADNDVMDTTFRGRLRIEAAQTNAQ